MLYLMKTLLLTLFCLLPVSWPAQSSPTPFSPNVFDKPWRAIYDGCTLIRDDLIAAQTKYMPQLKYTFAWPAQVYQESHCKLDARSPAGAMGPSQIMPGTWREVAEELRLPRKATPFDIVAIDAGAYYQSKMLAFWTADRPLVEKVYLGQASYNAGAGNILKAQRLSGGERYWRGIELFLPNVTGRHAAETQTYVKRIKIAWRRMCADKPRCRPEDL